MKPVTPDTVALMQELVTRPGIFRRFTSDSRPAVIEQIGVSGEVAAIPAVAAYLLDSAPMSLATSRAIAQLLEVASSEDLVTLDEEIRRSFDWQYQSGWKPSDLFALRYDESHKDAVFAVVSSHPNGYIREAAVRRLEGATSDIAVAFQLIRLNDWVKAVREAARLNILTLLQRREFAPFRAHLSLVFRLSECVRDDHTPIVEAVVRELTSDAATSALATALDNHSRFIRRKMYSLAMSLEGNHRKQVVVKCLTSTDPVLRLWAARDARRELPDELLTEVVARQLTDTFVPVRREAGLTVLERFPDQAVGTWEGMLLDHSSSLREFARFHLRKCGRVDFAATYRDAIAAGQKLAQAIAGVGESGTATDVAVVLPFLSSSLVSVRQAAVRATGSLAASQQKPLLMAALQDESPRVSTEARRPLKGLLGENDLGALRQIFYDDTRRHVRFSVIALLDSLPLWDSLPTLIAAASDLDSALASTAQRRVMARVNRVFTKPTSIQAALIDDALRSVTPALPVDFADQCRRWLQTRR